MKRLFIGATAALTIVAAFAQTPPQLPGKVVVNPGEKQLLYLSFKDQAAVDAGRKTEPVSVPISSDGTFVFPAPLPVGVTIATTPPCVDLAAIFVKSAAPREGTKAGDPPEKYVTEVNLLDVLGGANSAVSPLGYPKLGNVTQNQMTDFNWFGLFDFKTTSSTVVGKGGLSTSAGGSLGYGSLSASMDYAKAIGGVNLGCRNEKKAAGGAK